eukprot:s7542_g3.t1
MGERRQDVTPKQRLRSKCAVASLSFCSHARQAAWFHACVPPHHRNPSNHTLEPACRPQGPSPPCNWFTLLMNAMLADWQAGVATLLAATSDSILAGSDTWSRGFHPRAAVGLHSSTSTATLRSQVSSTKTHRKRLLLPGLPAQVRELRDAYSTVDSHVAENLERELKVLALEHEGIAVEEAKGMYAIVEHCHSCRIHHGLSTRHDEEEYLKRAASILELILQDLSDVILGSMKLPCKLEVEPRCLSNSYELGQDIWHHGSRVGI